MILWNTSRNTIESMYDGIPYRFTPGEKKKIFEPNIINHLIYKLEDYGLVQVSEEITKAEDLKKIEIQGLKNRQRCLDRIIRGWNTMNKEREAAKLSPAPPSDKLVEVCEELEEIEKKLLEASKDKIAIVNKHLNKDKEKESFKNASDKGTIEASGTGVKLNRKKNSLAEGVV